MPRVDHFVSLVGPRVMVPASTPISEFGSEHWPSIPRMVGFKNVARDIKQTLMSASGHLPNVHQYSVATDSERAPMLALSQQPVSFTVEADQFPLPCTRPVCSQHCAERSLTIRVLSQVTAPKVPRITGKPNRGAAPGPSRVKRDRKLERLHW